MAHTAVTRARASITATSTSLEDDPAVLTQHLGIEPDSSRRLGDVGRSGHVAQTSTWSIDTQEMPTPDQGIDRAVTTHSWTGLIARSARARGAQARGHGRCG